MFDHAFLARGMNDSALDLAHRVGQWSRARLFRPRHGSKLALQITHGGHHVPDALLEALDTVAIGFMATRFP